MKKYFYLLLVSLAAFMAASCSDELESDANDTAAVKSGQPICLINVGDETTNNGKKKMHYGELNGTKWPVCWDVNDAADVLCPEARWSDNPHSEATDVPSVSYKITGLTGTSGTIEKAGEKELCWGQANAHHFFQAFPAGAVDLSDVTKTKFSDNTNDYSANFTATISQSQVIPADSIKYDEDSKTYTARNMNYAVLVGTDRYMREELDEKEPIHLHYNTAFTAVEVTIEASAAGAFAGDYITAIDISNATTSNTGYEAIPLAGEFTGTVGYNGVSTYANNFKNSTTDVKLFNNVRIDLSAKPVTLEAGTDQTLKVTAFLLPTAGAQVKVTVNRRKIQKDKSLGAPLTISKSFKSGSSDEKALAAGKVNQLGMGALPVLETYKIDGDNWMTVLPDETYLSQMSIPGVYDCGAYNDNIHDADQAQYQLITPADDAAQMRAYLAAGNRAFDFKLNADTLDNGLWALTREDENKKSVEFSFKNMVVAAQTWLTEHPTECVICFISDYNQIMPHTTDASAQYDASGDFKWKEWQILRPYSDIYKKHIREFIIEQTPKSLLLASFDEKITLGEARGKMVIINASKYDNAIGLCSQWKINTRPYNNNWFQETRVVENEVINKGYPFTNGNYGGYIYVQDFNNLQRRGGTNNTIKGGDNGRTTNFSFDAGTKINFVKEALNSARVDNDAVNWYYTSSACRGWAWNFTTPYGMCPYWLAAVTTRTQGRTTYNGYKIHAELMNYISKMPTDKYEKLGFVMNACVGKAPTEEGITGMSRTLEQMIWENNYVGNGPLKKTTE